MVKKTDVKYQKIVRTAHDLFVSKGYDTVTISEVAREAGIAKGGMYYYFDSKEALLKAVHAQLAQEVARKVSEEITQAKKVGFDALQYFFERQNTHKKVYIALFGSLLHSDSEELTLLAARSLWEAYLPTLERIVEECNVTYPSHTARSITTLLAGLSLHVRNAQSPQEIQDLIDAHNQHITAIVGAPQIIRVVSPQFLDAIIKEWSHGI